MQDFQPVRSGQPLRIPARVWNALLDLARERMTRGPAGAGYRPAGSDESGVVLLKNTTESDLERFAILGIDSPLITPTENEQEFMNRVALEGSAPDIDDHIGRFAVLLEPLAAGAIGLGMVQGVTPLRLYVTTEGHDRAEIEDAKTAYLSSQWTGTAKILWKEAGESENDEDLKWAVVAFRGGGSIGASYVWRARVTGVHAADGGAWVSYAADGWQAYVTANPLYENGTPDEETTLLLKLTADCAEDEVGFKDVEVGDKIGYIIARDTADVPGRPSGTKYDGWVLLHGEDEGATLAALQHADGGPGITVDDTTDPFEPKVSVDLADPAGLEFIGGGDAGQLAVKPDTDHGIDVVAAGVQVVIDLGLQFDAGALEVKPNGAKAIAVDADGVAVKIDTAKGLEFDGDGELAVKPNGDKAVAVDADGVAVRVPTTPDRKGVIFTPGGELGAHVNLAAGCGVDDDGLFVILNNDMGLACDGDGIRVVLQAADSRLKFGGLGGLAHDVPGAVSLDTSTIDGTKWVWHLRADATGHTIAVQMDDGNWYDLEGNLIEE